MANQRDKTLLDLDRKLLSFHKSDVEKVLPEYFRTEYPQLIKLLEAYYEWMDSADNPNEIISKLHTSRDATQVPSRQLPFLEDELLLGQAYFDGFLNKREAIKFSNLLYRSKGTKYSIEQFFRGFFGVDPTVVYTKDNVFRVGPAIDAELAEKNTNGEQVKEEASIIGPESRRYLTNDQLYQTFAILIRTSIPLQKWIDEYKLFVHPAGVYIGAEILIQDVNVAGLTVLQDEVGDQLEQTLSITDDAVFDITAAFSLTSLNEGDDTYSIQRQTVYQQFRDNDTITFTDQMASATQGSLLSPNSITFDDSEGSGYFDFSTSYDSDTQQGGFVPTFGSGKFNTLFDSANSADSAHYPFEHL